MDDKFGNNLAPATLSGPRLTSFKYASRHSIVEPIPRTGRLSELYINNTERQGSKIILWQMLTSVLLHKVLTFSGLILKVGI